MKKRKLILGSGIPKSGTHLLMKIAEILGLATFYSQRNGVPDRARELNCLVHGHYAYSSKNFINENFTHHLYIVRHPKNVLMSWCRHRGHSWDEKNLLWAMHNFYSHRKPSGGAVMTECYEDHEGWLLDYKHQISYEALLKDSRELQRVCAVLDEPFDESYFFRLPGGTRTYHLTHANWTLYWTDHLQQEWEKIGMSYYESEVLGYE